MSAFVVDDSTINRIVGYCRFADRFDLRQLAALGFGPGDSDGKAAELGRAMWELNISSVGQRYTDCATAADMPGSTGQEYRFRLDPNARPVQTLKSLRCFLYQSCEGDCMEAPLYQALEALSGDLAHSIVAELDEYKAAAWS